MGAGDRLADDRDFVSPSRLEGGASKTGRVETEADDIPGSTTFTAACLG